MFWAILLFSLFCTVWTQEVFFPKKETKTPEQELGEAIAKYLSSLKKKDC